MSSQIARRNRATIAVVSLAMGMGLCPGAWASDPLEDLDGTEGWDQVVQPAPERKPAPKPEQVDMQAEIAQWESIRVTWEQERERYLRERAVQKTMAARMQPAARAKRTLEINDENLDQVTGDDWGDAPGEQWLVPAGAVDRAIDEELSESKPAAPPPERRPPPLPAAPPPAALAPPPEASGAEDVPSAFTQQKRKDLGGGLAPTAPDPDAPLPPTAAPQPAAASADEGAKAAAEMLRKQQEEQRRAEAEDKARREAEADAGAAAAAELLRQQAERERKEQEALRKKAGVEEDDDGQMVDPDLQREMEEDD